MERQATSLLPSDQGVLYNNLGPDMQGLFVGMTVIVASNLKEITFPSCQSTEDLVFFFFFLITFYHLGPSSPFLTLIIVTGKKNSTMAHGTLISP